MRCQRKAICQLENCRVVLTAAIQLLRFEVLVIAHDFGPRAQHHGELLLRQLWKSISFEVFNLSRSHFQPSNPIEILTNPILLKCCFRPSWKSK